MSVRTILAILVGILIPASQAYSRGQIPPQTPSQVARLVADQGPMLKLPVKGKVKHSIRKTAPTFTMPGGSTTAVLLQLPDAQERYILTIASFRRGIGRTTEMFIPIGVFFDSEYQQLSEFGESSLAGKEESVVAEFVFNTTSVFAEKNKNARYLLLYTRGDLIGQRMDMKGDFGAFNVGLVRLERSLEANIQVETRPEARPK